jgi:hypothetical protein
MRTCAPCVLALALAACGKGEDSEGPPGPGTTTSPTDDEAAPPAPSPRVYRLTHAQWERTTTDLLRLDAPSGLSDGFIGDTLIEQGFDNNGDALAITPELFRDYQLAAETLAATVATDAELYARVVPQDPREGGVAFELHVEVESDPTVTMDNGAESGLGWMLWSDGALRIPVEIPVTTEYTLTARLSGSDCGDGVGALAELGVDGATWAEVETTEAYASYTASGPITVGSHTVEVRFTNDCWDPESGIDRNLIVDWVELEGSGGALGASTATDADAQAWIEDFGTRAYRRPLTAAEQSAWFDVFARGPELVGTGDDFADGVRLVVMAMLQSPNFLYRLELSESPDGAGRMPLSDHELASKLSYALWGTMPDDALFARAAAGELHTEEHVREVARELLADPRAAAAVSDFHAQLYLLDNTINIVKDSDDFPMYNAEIPGWMRQEAERFVDAVVWEDDGGLLDLLSADWTVSNRSLAQLYGADGPASDDAWERVELEAAERAGLLTQSWFLAMQADATTPSPIHRGVFINKQILCVDLPDPPPNVTALPPTEAGQTNRERVEAHTGIGTCGETCHGTMINPPGFALENYDAIGQYRTLDNGFPVNASDTYYLSDGANSWTTGVEFAHLIAGHPDTHQCYATRWLEYLLARGADPGDDPLLEPIALGSAEGMGVQDVIVEIVASDLFRSRVDEVTP